MEEEREVVPLVRVTGEGEYVAEESTLKWLSERKDPFVVMMLAGKFRTGKSFLLNRVMESPPGCGFGVGDTVQACTRGIWVCKRFLQVEGGRDVLVVDTEGIDALDVESAHDMRIFALAVLLGSAFCFNSHSHIDEAAVQTLSLMTRVASSMSSVSHSPSLYWILRDFSLSMVDEKGEAMTHEQYLESALSPSSGGNKCSTREAIKSIFQKRHLVTLPRPHKSEASKLEKMDKKGNSSSCVNAKFERFVHTFRSHVSKNAPCISAGGVPMTGAIYASYVDEIVRLVNTSGSVPPLCDAWSLLTSKQHSEAFSSVRERLLFLVHSSCPTASEEEVKEWIRRSYAREEEKESFMSPHPSAPEKEEAERKAREVAFLAAKGTGKVVDAKEMARREVESILERMSEEEDARKWDVSSLLDRDSVFSSIAMQSFFETAWPKVVRLVDELVSRADDLDERRISEMTLRQELEARLPLSLEDASTSTDDLPSPPLPRTSSPPPPLVDEDEVNDLKDSLAEKEGAISALQEKISEFEKGINLLKEEALHEIQEAKKEASSCSERALASEREREQEAARAHSLAKETEKMRGLVQSTQDKIVEMHRRDLEEGRRREAEARSHAEIVRREHSDLRGKAEAAEREVRTLKRRVDELIATDEEAKRLKIALSSSEKEAEIFKKSLDKAREEKDRLRGSNIDLTSKLAVFEATSKLDSCRRFLKDAP